MWNGKNKEEGKTKYFGQFFTSFPITFRVNELEGVMNHEVSTHYLRGYNERS